MKKGPPKEREGVYEENSDFTGEKTNRRGREIEYIECYSVKFSLTTPEVYNSVVRKRNHSSGRSRRQRGPPNTIGTGVADSMESPHRGWSEEPDQGWNYNLRNSETD
jgi:hypothetical protein